MQTSKNQRLVSLFHAKIPPFPKQTLDVTAHAKRLDITMRLALPDSSHISYIPIPWIHWLQIDSLLKLKMGLQHGSCAAVTTPIKLPKPRHGGCATVARAHTHGRVCGAGQSRHSRLNMLQCVYLSLANTKSLVCPRPNPEDTKNQ